MTLRAKFILDASKNPKRLAAYAWDAMQLASTHDPDHAKELKKLYAESIHAFKRVIDLQQRVSRVERQLDRITKKVFGS